MNRFLQSRQEVDGCTKYITDNDFIPHPLSCKNFDIANICPKLTHGSMIDLGSAGGSSVLENAVHKKILGLKVGIDLSYSENVVSDKPGIDLVSGDLMNTPFPDNLFNTIFCLSVIEHEVDISLLAKECSRIISNSGTLYLTFDYWPEKIDTDGLKLYGLSWNIFDENDVRNLIKTFYLNDFALTSEMDWKVSEKVINPTYCSPFQDVSYTFGLLEFKKY